VSKVPSTVEKAMKLINASKYQALYTAVINYEINNGTFSFVTYDARPHEEVRECMYDGDIIHNALENANRLYIPPNKFISENLKYSPFEADNTAKDAFKTDFALYPPFTSLVESFIFVNGLFPTFDEFAMMYLSIYFEPSTKKLDDEVYRHYKAIPPRFNIGKQLKSKETTFVNKVIVANQYARKYYSCYPCVELTTDMVLNRLYKAYPSIIRKIYTVFAAAAKSNTVHYNTSKNVFGGMHFTINNRPVQIRFTTKTAQHFQKVKAERYPDLKGQKIVNFVFNSDNATPGEFLLPSEEGIDELIRVGNIPRLFMSADVSANP
jgi:hypothetical protein